MAESGKIIIYTDGAAKGNPGPGGWGVVVWYNGEVVELGGGEGYTTNNFMEMTAVIAALEFAVQQDGPVKILLDSKYVKDGIESWILNWKRNGWVNSRGKEVIHSETWKRMDSLNHKLQKRGIIWQYVPAHRGIPGNERADAIASGFALGEDVVLYKGRYDEYGIDLRAGI